MSITLPEKKEIDPKEKPLDNAGDDEILEEEVINEEQEPVKANDAEDKARKLEIELAEARGKLSVLNQPSAPQPEKTNPAEEQYFRTKQVVQTDISAMDDDAFRTKYNMTKADVKIHFMEYERNLESQKTSEKVAKMEAENEILSKYGSSYAKYKSEVNKAIEDASPEVRKDPARLSKFIERTYLALSRDEKDEKPTKIQPKKEGETMNRRIANDFDAPTPRHDVADRNKEKNDSLEGEDLEIGRHFGITTKSEREKYNGRHLEMNFGHGVVLRDPKKGFEKISK